MNLQKAWTKPEPFLAPEVKQHTCRVSLLKVRVSTSMAVQVDPFFQDEGLSKAQHLAHAERQTPEAILFHTSTPLWLSLYLHKSLLKMSPSPLTL